MYEKSCKRQAKNCTLQATSYKRQAKNCTLQATRPTPHAIKLQTSRFRPLIKKTWQAKTSNDVSTCQALLTY
jgi:hypothetical protein